MLDRPERTEHRRGMHDCIEASQLRFECARHVREVVGARFRQIERQNDRFRMTSLLDLVVERFKLAHDASMQDNRGAGDGARERQRFAETTGRACNQNDAIA
jgi:hypothetical protein